MSAENLGQAAPAVTPATTARRYQPGTPARIMLAGGRAPTDRQIAGDALNAGLALLGAPIFGSTLVYSPEPGGDEAITQEASRIGLSSEAHITGWCTHTEACPEPDKQSTFCEMANRRSTVRMLGTGIDLCIAFPAHGYALSPGQDDTNTSREVWERAELSKTVGTPTLVVWGREFYPFGHPGMELLRIEAASKQMALGPQGQLSILNTWLPF